MGINLYNDEQLRELAEQVNAAVRSDWRAGPLVPGAKPSTAATVEVTSPADRRQLVGHWQPADAAGIAQAMDNAGAAQPAWHATPSRKNGVEGRGVAGRGTSRCSRT